MHHQHILSYKHQRNSITVNKVFQARAMKLCKAKNGPKTEMKFTNDKAQFQFSSMQDAFGSIILQDKKFSISSQQEVIRQHWTKRKPLPGILFLNNANSVFTSFCSKEIPAQSNCHVL